ncbi:MAG: hypothetical protein J07HQW1_01828 [Haloquadratum walsbyi J07HQW1]|uniref:Uncharacterized protein n=1 Tax=Haloquadratum walsbyi J07HQW1 TaxID=1238424 RepID=U1MPD6_9EURY|nr:MAG: hypothetical protein J07HQW1_01828 [Haloquadratum walsbyi J07HQW1]
MSRRAVVIVSGYPPASSGPRSGGGWGMDVVVRIMGVRMPIPSAFPGWVWRPLIQRITHSSFIIPHLVFVSVDPRENTLFQVDGKYLF